MEETVYKRSNKGKAISKKDDGHLRLRTDTSSIRINKTILIGRDKSCKLQIDDPLVSRRHAMIEFISKVAYIKDLGSTNATYVNNNPLRPNEQKRLRRGDVIRIGKTEITIS
ncbi:FHA domain-containing protein [Spirochaeta isovalerica]|uniref:PSer/pThr/pTyr-binding forkhead associated (FHA) protein n=1 Tax=Spirochaeta isovalerica TaxID=150 RepID=A0A841R8A3_9SPIO|nr:FHA domain-containing protein [Spirochaeta isovalerica]MBB6480115.1 pSer/pThr/pTyr-binding forkhead associated (FHA) protein [Spirochaeta isovalerica]